MNNNRIKIKANNCAPECHVSRMWVALSGAFLLAGCCCAYKVLIIIYMLTSVRLSKAQQVQQNVTDVTNGR